MGASWISRKEGILEKGGMTPLTNYEYGWFHSNFYITITYYKYTVTNNLDQIQSLIYRLLFIYIKWTSSFQVLNFLKIWQHTKCFVLILDSENWYLVHFWSTHHAKHFLKNYIFHYLIFSKKNFFTLPCGASKGFIKTL